MENIIGSDKSSVNSASFARNYNLPIYFQAVDGVSPSESGIRSLPTILAICKFCSHLQIAQIVIANPK
jgi:hypothetical protein